jgi:hypothetical protein
MLRWLSRTIGLLLVAGGFVMMVVDGAKSIANSMLMLTPLSDVISSNSPSTLALWQAGVEKYVPVFVWNPLLTSLLTLPSFLFFAGLGASLMWFGQKPDELIGFDTHK